MNLKRKVMRPQNILALFLLVFVFAACDKEDIQLPEASIESNQVLLTKSQETIPDSRLFTKGTIPAGEPVLLRALQWTSFLTARTLKHHPLSRQEFNSQATVDGVYDLNALLDLDGLYPSFSSEFRDVLYLYAAGRPDQEHEPNRPLAGGTGNMSIGAQVQAFLDFILISNCIELYVPNGLSNFSTEYSTTGHPLNIEPYNFGFRRLAVPITIDGDNINVVGIDIFNDLYVQTHANVIIARPDRSPTGGFSTSGDDSADICNYAQYSVDFNLFLDQ